MHRAVARKPLKAFPHIYQYLYLLIRLIRPPQFRIFFQCLINCNIEFLRNHLCNRIYKSIREIHHTAYIPDHTSCRQGSECYNLYHAVFSVFSYYIVNHFLPPFEAEIHINIRHRHTFRIKETLKKKLISDGIDCCDLQTIGNNTAGRRSPARPYCNPVILGIFNEIPYDKKIIYISHIPDRIKLVGQSVLQLLRRFAVPAFQALTAEFLEIFPGCKSFRHVKFGEFGHAELNFH